MVGGFNGQIKIYDFRQLKDLPLASHQLAEGGLWRISPKKIEGGFRLGIATCSENVFLIVNEECSLK